MTMNIVGLLLVILCVFSCVIEAQQKDLTLEDQETQPPADKSPLNR